MAHIVWQDKNSNTKRAKVVYECRSITGERVRKSHTFPPRTPMKDINSFKSLVEHEYKISQGLNYSKITFAEFTEKYFQLFGSQLSPTTLRTYKMTADSPKHGFLKYIGNIRLDKLKKSDIQLYINSLIEVGLSGKTIKNSVWIVRAIYNKAIQLGYVFDRSGNITDNVVLPRCETKKIDAYTPDEVKVLLRYAEQDGDIIIRLLIFLAIGSGMRRSEMSALRLDDYDEHNHTITVNKARVYVGKGKSVIKMPKTKAGRRVIPVPEDVGNIIEERIEVYNKNKQEVKDFEDSGYLFSDEKGHPLCTSVLSNRYSRFVKKHEIRYISLHGLRHTYGSLLISNGANIKVTQSLMGHSSASTTLNVYTSAYLSDKNAQAELLNKELFEKIS